jgi:multidrug efflux pump
VVQPLLSTVDGVASADILGGQTFAMRIWLDPQRLAARDVSAADVQAAILRQQLPGRAGPDKGLFHGQQHHRRHRPDRRQPVPQHGGQGARRRAGAAEGRGDGRARRPEHDSSVAMNGQQRSVHRRQRDADRQPADLGQGRARAAADLERSLPPTLNEGSPTTRRSFIQASIDEVTATLAEAVGIVIVVIFLFLGTFRSVLIPVVTIPLSLIGAGMIMLALGFSLNLLTLLAMVLAIGLVVDDAIVVVENVYRHIEEGRTPVQAALIGAREIVGPVIAMTITLAAVYAPIGFLSGLTGALFREFAFTLAGAVVDLRHRRADALADDVLAAADAGDDAKGGWRRLVDGGFARVTRCYGRRLSASLDYRPVIALFAARRARQPSTSSTATAPPSWRRRRTRASSSPSPRRRNTPTSTIPTPSAPSSTRSSSPSPRPTTTFVVNGTDGPNNGFAGMILKPWGERDTLREAAAAAGSAGRRRDPTACSAFVWSPAGAARLDRRPAGADGDQLAARFQTVYEVMEKIKEQARKSGLFIVTDSDLQFNNPVSAIDRRPKANDLGITMQAIGETLAVLARRQLRQPLQPEGRSYEVIPQVPRATRLTPDMLTRYYVPRPAASRCRSRPWSRWRTAPTRTRLPTINQLNSATFSAVPMPGVTIGQAVAFLEEDGTDAAAGLQPRLARRIAAIRAGGQPAHDHLRLRPDRHLPGAGGAVREPARPAGDHDQRADVDLRRAHPAVLRAERASTSTPRSAWSP